MNRKYVLTIAVLCTVLIEPIQAFADIKLGVFPRRPADVTQKTFQPLAEQMSKELGETVQVIVPPNFKEFWKGVENKEYDIVHYNQYHYVKSNKEYGYRVIVANEEFGNKSIAGALIVRKDSGINSVSDLKGKTILFGGGKKAMGSYIAPTAILQKAGLKEGIDYKVKFAKNPPSAVVGVYKKQADVAASGNVILKIKGVTKKIDTSEMKILAESDSFIHLPWAVKDSLSPEKTDKLQSFMLSLGDSKEGKLILKAAKVTGFQKVSDDDFSVVRDIAANVELLNKQFASDQ